jgi:hypothetical protein
MAVNYSYCTPDDGDGKYPKYVKWSCNKIKILVLHLVGHFVCIFIEKYARNHERNIDRKSFAIVFVSFLSNVLKHISIICTSS